MSFRDSFLKKKEKTKRVVEKVIPTAGSPLKHRTPRLQKTALSDLENLTNTISQVIEEKLQNITETIKIQSELIQQYKPLTPRLWNEENRFNFMQIYSRPDKKGFKAVEMFTHFGSEQVTWSDVTIYIQDVHKLGMLRKNRDGWYKLTPKGREHHQKLREVKK